MMQENRTRQLDVTVRFIAAAVLLVGLVAAVFGRISFSCAAPLGWHQVVSLGDLA